MQSAFIFGCAFLSIDLDLACGTFLRMGTFNGPRGLVVGFEAEQVHALRRSITCI